MFHTANAPRFFLPSCLLINPLLHPLSSGCCFTPEGTALSYARLDISSSPKTKFNQAAKAAAKMKYSGDGFPSGLLLFDMFPGPAIKCPPLCIKTDNGSKGFAPAQKKGSAWMPGGRKDRAKGWRETWGRPQAPVQPRLEGRCSLLHTRTVALFPPLPSPTAHQRQLLALANMKCISWSLPRTLTVQLSGALYLTLQPFPVLA